ncbi:MAG: type II secretion system protein GspL [Pseudomonadota bacterium]
MSQQLVLSINNTADNFRWCWLQDGQPQASASGNLEALRAAVGGVAQQVWLLLPGIKVVTRELEYTEKEKKHLRNLLPFQLEDSVVGDIDDLHFAIGEAVKGKVTVSYTDKSWLREIFQQLSGIGIEISRCWSTPTLLPLAVPPSALASNEITLEELDGSATPTWVVALQDGIVNLRFGEQKGFTLPKGHFLTALDMLLNAQGLTNNLPNLVLRASSETELKILFNLLPANLAEHVRAKMVVNEWQLDFDGRAIDLCQAEFSQRLPIERWLKLWRNLGILALVTLAVYVSVLVLHSFKLNRENMQIRQQTETLFRTVVPHGPTDDPEKKLRIKLAGMQPKAETGSVVNLLAGILPLIASNPDVVVKSISYMADAGEINISIQTHSFNSIDSLRQAIVGQGFTAELLSANSSGEIHTARLKISKPLAQ